MSMAEDFKAFAFKGNVVDLAVGVIIGGAFGKIVSSFVDNIIMPVVSLAMPEGSWKESGFYLAKVYLKDGVTIDDKLSKKLAYGAFLGNVLDFVILAFILFLIVTKLISAFKKTEAAAEPSAQEKLLAEIRDLLKKAEFTGTSDIC